MCVCVCVCWLFGFLFKKLLTRAEQCATVDEQTESAFYFEIATMTVERKVFAVPGFVDVGALYDVSGAYECGGQLFPGNIFSERIAERIQTDLGIKRREGFLSGLNKLPSGSTIH